MVTRRGCTNALALQIIRESVESVEVVECVESAELVGFVESVVSVKLVESVVHEKLSHADARAVGG